MPARERQLGRGERVIPGLWRLRLPLPWSGVPHCNAWAIAAGSGFVLVDGRISLYFDYGWTRDPVGEFLGSLEVTAALGARLCLSGHGKPFVDVPGHIEGNRKLVAERLAAVAAALSDDPRTAVEISPSVYGEPLTEANASWLLAQTLAYLSHLEHRGRATREPRAGVERGTAAGGAAARQP